MNRSVTLLAILAVATFAPFWTGCKKAATGATQYTCPMHPEVVTNAPGKCPKCGMDLVKKS